MADNEEWRAIPGYEGSYEASSLGRIRSLTRVTDRGRRWKGRLMTPCPLNNGYLIVTLWKGGEQRSRLVHRLVLSAFAGPPAEGIEAMHGDGNRTNNAIGNLSWGTHAENQLAQVGHGTHVNASKDACPSGHPYTPENTYIYPGRPHRGCRECRREHMRKWREKNRADTNPEANKKAA